MSNIVGKTKDWDGLLAPFPLRPEVSAFVAINIPLLFLKYIRPSDGLPILPMDQNNQRHHLSRVGWREMMEVKPRDETMAWGDSVRVWKD